MAIVEDDRGIRQSLEWLLKSTPEFTCVAACDSAEDALQALPKAAPEVILMDINLPNLSGIECTARIKELLPAVQVVMITVYGDSEKVFNALRAGASGYILKRAAPERILEAIREVHAGGVPMSSEIARKVPGDISRTGFGARRRTEPFAAGAGSIGTALARLQQQGDCRQTVGQH